MKKTLIITFITSLIILIISPIFFKYNSMVRAVSAAPGDDSGHTEGGGSDIIGKIEAPPGVKKYNEKADIGLILFISNIYKLVTIVAGIWSFFNIIFAGYIYVFSPGKSDSAQQVTSKLTNTMIGLAIIVTAYTITALISLIIFGDAGFILNPQLQSI